MGRFEAGNPGGPGRPSGSWGGRRRALQVIDELLADEGNLETLRRSLQERFNRDPVRFWLRIGAPLVPRSAKLELAMQEPDEGRGLYAAVLAALNPPPADGEETPPR